MSVPRWRTDASRSVRLFWRHFFFRALSAVEYIFVPSPPNLRLISSTYFIRSIAFCLPMYSCRDPPKSFVMLYFPSENAPAPPKPFIIAQDLQLMQDLILIPSMGHLRFLSSLPASKTAILRSVFFSVSWYAEKIPPGPAPIIITS